MATFPQRICVVVPYWDRARLNTALASLIDGGGSTMTVLLSPDGATPGTDYWCHARLTEAQYTSVSGVIAAQFPSAYLYEGDTNAVPATVLAARSLTQLGSAAFDPYSGAAWSADFTNATITSGKLETLPQRSGSNHATQSNASLRPAWTSSDSNFSNRPTFTGAESCYLPLTSSITVDTGAFTLAFVVKPGVGDTTGVYSQNMVGPFPYGNLLYGTWTRTQGRVSALGPTNRAQSVVVRGEATDASNTRITYETNNWRQSWVAPRTTSSISRIGLNTGGFDPIRGPVADLVLFTSAQGDGWLKQYRAWAASRFNLTDGPSRGVLVSGSGDSLMQSSGVSKRTIPQIAAQYLNADMNLNAGTGGATMATIRTWFETLVLPSLQTEYAVRKVHIAKGGQNDFNSAGANQETMWGHELAILQACVNAGVQYYRLPVTPWKAGYSHPNPSYATDRANWNALLADRVPANGGTYVNTMTDTDLNSGLASLYSDDVHLNDTGYSREWAILQAVL